MLWLTINQNDKPAEINAEPEENHILVYFKKCSLNKIETKNKKIVGKIFKHSHEI